MTFIGDYGVAPDKAAKNEIVKAAAQRSTWTSDYGEIANMVLDFGQKRGQSAMKRQLVAVLIFSLPIVVSAQELKRRVPRYHYFYCAAVHRILAEAYKHTGNKVSEAVQKSKAERLYQEGKKDLIEVGKNPSEAEGRVQKNVARIVDELKKDPQKIHVHIFGCADDFPV